MERTHWPGLAGVLVFLLALSAPAASAKTRFAATDVPLKSSNVSLKLTLPGGKPVGARFRDNYMFVTGTEGVSAYDISNPELPTPAGFLPLPHFENEDVDIGGNYLLVSNDPSEGVGILYVIDISAYKTGATGPQVLKLAGPPLAEGDLSDSGLLAAIGVPATFPLPKGTGHTVSCVNPSCTYAYLAGTDDGIVIADLTDPANPKIAGRFKPDITGLTTHDVQIDDTGLAWVVGADGTEAFDVRNPLKPKPVMRTDESITNSGQLGFPKTSVPDQVPFFGGFTVGGNGENPIDLIHHDSLRLGSWARGGPRGTRIEPGLNLAPYKQVPGKTYPAGGDSPLLGIVEEDYNRPTCQGAGEFQLWGITTLTTSKGLRKLGLLSRYQTELNKLITDHSGWAPVTGLCSAHYFDYRDGIVAGGWYEEGTRFLDVRDPLHVKQVGYWVPTKGETWSVVYAPTDPTGQTVYALDYARGIDVLHLDRGSLAPRAAPVRRSWLTGVHGPQDGHTSLTGLSQPSRFGFVCRLPLFVT